MRTRLKFLLAIIISTGLLLLGVWFFKEHPVAVLNPAGIIARQQRDLLVVTTLLMLLIVVPVFGLTFFIAWKYRATNKKADYQPEWDHNRKLETIWWGFPCAIIAVLAVIAWTSSHQLDPFKPLDSPVEPLKVQVVALQWKWLFIYPEQQIASVNHLEIPAGRPINFEITADAPMNSFWIPRLGGQVYAMAGMSTKLHLMADKPGSFYGSSANLSGEGFSDMNFMTKASTNANFDMWVRTTKTSSNDLDWSTYLKLAEPGKASEQSVFATYERNLYDKVIAKYMSHQKSPGTENTVHSTGASHD